MFTRNLVILSLIACIGGDQEGCKKIPINSVKMYGHCCVFIKNEDLRYANDHVLEAIIKDNLSPIENPNNIHLPTNQKTEEVHSSRPSLGCRPHAISPRPVAGHPRSPEYFQNVIIPINSDKVYGECCVFVKENLRQENNKIIRENFSLNGNTEGRRPPPNQRIQPSQLPLDFPSNNIPPRPIASRPLLDIQKDLKAAPPRNYNLLAGNYTLDQIVPSDMPIIMTDSQKSFEANSSNKQKETIFKKSHEHTLSITSDDNSSDFTFPTEENISTTISSPDISKTNATNMGKMIIDLGNRNAVDVPPIGCPTGQSKDPSGKCISPF